MKNLYIAFAFLLFTSTHLAAQTYTVSGTIKTSMGQGIASATVMLKNTTAVSATDFEGNYQLKDIKPGSYTLKISAIGYATVNKVIKVDGNLTVSLTLDSSVTELNAVEIKKQKEKTFGVTRLKAVEGTTINAGKKSEVIVMNDVTANTATNNTRQIYSKVAGLNIWESDGAGIQLGIGGRGLNPNRVTNFNTRQNGYDISADALGYPESYYTPPAELVDRIEILRGASSLQYGTQFGGLINFKLKDGTADKPFEANVRQTAGSWGFLNTSVGVGGTDKKVQYYAYYQHKQGDGWRPHGEFNVNTAYTSVTYKPTDRFSVTLQYTYMDYLAHQPGGLTDDEFAVDPHQSVRTRNWFKVNWNLGAAIFDYRITDNLKFNSRFFGLLASRDATGNLGPINLPDDGSTRDLYKDKYHNYGNESRLLYTYKINNNVQNLLVGFRYYSGHTDRQVGHGNDGSTGNPSDFDYQTATDYTYTHYKFPNENVALFAENIFMLTPKLSLIPGVRYENIITNGKGSYNNVFTDHAGNIISTTLVNEDFARKRHFLLGGIGLSYLQSQAIQVYANISQNYRAINFSDIRPANKNYTVDPNLQDETGYSADLGMRGTVSDYFNYDVSLFTINYDNRIGTQNVQGNPYRTNIGKSRSLGLESFAELEFLHYLNPDATDTRLSIFTNLALINAKYLTSKEKAYVNNKVELAPNTILKTGLSLKHKKLTLNYQFAYTSSQYSDATNAIHTDNAVLGLVPSYTVMDISANYKLNKTFTLEGSVNNLADARYFTRRADSYPGPGIIPADARSFFLTLQVKL